MKIKNSGIIILLTTLAVVTVSCNKLLDVPPQGKLTLDQFWLSEDQAVAAVAGIYSNLGSTKSTTSKGLSAVECFIYWGDMRGDQLASNSSRLPTGQEAKANMDLLLPAPTDITTNYTSLYRIINFANQAIKNLPAIVTKDPAFTITDMEQLMGEAYFLRAYAYFWLVRTFREVPLVLEPSETDEQDYNIAKSPADTLFAQIVKDLEAAKQTLPQWYANPQYSRSRATKYTAMTVLADVYLWMAATSGIVNKNALYEKAIQNCDAVINSKKYFLIPGALLSDVFVRGNSDETIFETYANSKLNNQVNDLKTWFATYFTVTFFTDNLFTATTTPDYRGFNPPVPGTGIISGNKSGYDGSTRFILKFNSATNDSRWIFYRYSDILLMKAEALAHRYKDDPVQLQRASDLVNEVRARAFEATNFPTVSASTTSQMDEILLDERGREFLGEGKRWFDLVRFASRDNFLRKDLLIDRVLNSFTGVNQLSIGPRVKDPQSWYLPLNADALAANPRLVQNPYYQ